MVVFLRWEVGRGRVGEQAETRERQGVGLQLVCMHDCRGTGGNAI